MSNKGKFKGIENIKDKFTGEEMDEHTLEILNRVTDIAPTTLYIYDLLEKRNIWANRDILQSLGYSSTDLQDFGSEVLAKLMHPQDATRYEKHDKRLRRLKSGETVEFEYRLRHKDGGWRWFLSREIAFAFAPDGTVSQIIGASTDITPQREPEEKMRESEERYRALVEASAQVVWTMNAEGSADSHRQWFYQLTGKSIEEIKDKDYLNFIHPNDRENLQKLWTEVTKNPVPYEIEFRLAPKKENYHYYNLRGVPLFNRDGSLREWIGTIKDVTDELESRNALKESEKQMRVVTDSMPALISYIDADCRYLFVNKTYTDWFGYTSAEVIGKTMPEILGASAFEVLRPHVEAAFAGKTETFEAETPYKDGGSRYIHATYTPDFAADGTVKGIFVLVLDLTEQKRAEIATARLAAIVESSDDAIISKDLNGIIKSWNNGAQKVFGYTAEEIVGKSITTLLPENRLDEENYILSRIRSGERVDHYETLRRRKDGTEISISITVSPLRDKTGKIIGASKIARDITEQKRTERERELMLEREQDLRKQAENASRLKDEFLATVSHELRTPLNAILGWAAMVRQRGFDTGLMIRAFEVIERNARNQNQIISDILDVSRIITGKLNLNLKSLELSNVVRAAVDTVRPAIDAKQIQLKINLESDFQFLLGDAERLQQVFWNLLSNAVKFTPEGGKIEIAGRTRNGFAEVSITDNGSGIKPEFLPFVFDRFRQADGKTTRKHGGLGLGLAIARNLVELHGGSVAVTSTGTGLGSTFTVRLPSKLQPPENLTTQISGADAEISAKPHQLLDGLKILIVDDEPDALELVGFILSDQGAKVLKAQTVDTALTIFDAEQPDIVISDIGMPEKDGYALVREIKERSGGDIPVVALTAYAGETDNKRALQAGFHSYLPKPLDPSELIYLIARLSPK